MFRIMCHTTLPAACQKPILAPVAKVLRRCNGWSRSVVHALLACGWPASVTSAVSKHLREKKLLIVGSLSYVYWASPLFFLTSSGYQRSSADFLNLPTASLPIFSISTPERLITFLEGMSPGEKVGDRGREWD